MDKTSGTILLIGASRGLGLGLAGEFLGRGWSVVATARNPDQADGLTKLKHGHDGKLKVEAADVTAPDAGQSLAQRLAGTSFDIIFVVAGQAKTGTAAVHETDARTAADEFVTNAFAPPVLAESLLPLLAPGGIVVFMTSVLGSIAQASGAMEVYGATKAALNHLGASFAKRHPDRRVVLMHPGWVKTDMGGAQAPLDVGTSVRGMADVLLSQTGTGVVYLDYAGKQIPW